MNAVVYKGLDITTSSSACLVGFSEQVNQILDASTLPDGDFVSRDPCKLSQSSHYIDQHFLWLIRQEADQGRQGVVLLKPFRDKEKQEHTGHCRNHAFDREGIIRFQMVLASVQGNDSSKLFHH